MVRGGFSKRLNFLRFFSLQLPLRYLLSDIVTYWADLGQLKMVKMVKNGVWGLWGGWVCWGPWGPWGHWGLWCQVEVTLRSVRSVRSVRSLMSLRSLRSFRSWRSLRSFLVVEVIFGCWCRWGHCEVVEVIVRSRWGHCEDTLRSPLTPPPKEPIDKKFAICPELGTVRRHIGEYIFWFLACPIQLFWRNLIFCVFFTDFHSAPLG